MSRTTKIAAAVLAAAAVAPAVASADGVPLSTPHSVSFYDAIRIDGQGPVQGYADVKKRIYSNGAFRWVAASNVTVRLDIKVMGYKVGSCTDLADSAGRASCSAPVSSSFSTSSLVAHVTRITDTGAAAETDSGPVRNYYIG
ncbi:MAG TPA: hypothetical protein VD931_09250 [Baekduia sp.]|nr:hypothetical protein [Baekduia sp.]